MIVICTKCQAKFRVADEKIGPRGAKVRCSKCQTVFLVHPQLGTLPVSDGDARVPTGATPVPPTTARPPAEPASPPARDPFADRDPFAAPPPAADPFASADPFARPAPAADPFGGRDPFAAPPPAPQGGPSPDGLGAPFVAAVSPRATLVTDLSDLMRAPGAMPPPPLPGASAAPPPLPFPPAAPPVDDPFAAPAAPPPADDPFAAPAAPPRAEDDPFGLAAPGGAPPAPAEPAGPAALADPFASEDPFAGAVAATPGATPEPELDLTASTPARPEARAADLDVGGLSLEDRLTPPPRAIAPEPAPLDQPLETATSEAAEGAPADPFAAIVAAPPGGAAEPFDRGAFDFGGEPGESLETAGAQPAAAPAPPPPPAPRAERAAEAAPARATSPTATTAVTASAGGGAAAEEAPDRIPDRRGSRLRAIAVNAVALVALLMVALAIWAVWRTDGPLEAAALRPSAILAALRHGGTAGPWSAQDVRSGVYDRVRGAPLLFVRGRVVSRAAAAVPSVKVAVQVVRGGQVLARGEALAGAVPTEEELYVAGDDAAIAAVASAARPRAPAAVRPGDAVPFLVAIGDAPPDLEGASLRIEVVPAARTAP
jgi:predicted Zn finger-like uncharacterized protein